MARTLLITGATDGLGRALATRAFADGWTVLAHGAARSGWPRSRTSCPAIRTLRADLAALAEVAALAAQVQEATERLDVLVSNAGVGFTEPGGGQRLESADGHELRFAVNYLAGYSLIAAGCCRCCAPRRPRASCRSPRPARTPIDFGDVMLERGYDGTRAYSSPSSRRSCSRSTSPRSSTARRHRDRAAPGTFMPTKMVTRRGIAPVTPLEHGRRRDLAADRRPRAGRRQRRLLRRRRARRGPDGQALDADDRRALRELSERLTGV